MNPSSMLNTSGGRRMRYANYIGRLVLGILALLPHSSKAQDRAATVPPAITFSDTATRWFAELDSAMGAGAGLWGRDLRGPVLMVWPGTREVFANAIDSAGVLSPLGSVFHGQLPTEVSISNTALEWSGRRWTMVMLPLSDDRKERIGLLGHELFHQAQPTLGFTPREAANEHLDSSKGRLYLRAELEALRHSLWSKTDSEMRKHLVNAFVFRAYRQHLFPGSDSTENMLELNEGLAEFTGAMLSGRDQQEMKRYFDESLDAFLLNPTFVRSFAYCTTPMQGFLLSRSDPTWNRNVTNKTDLTGLFLQAFNITLPSDLKGTIDQCSEEYGLVKIAAEETEREARTNAEIARYRTLLVDGAHLEIGFEHMNISYDPRNIRPLTGEGTVYPNLRVVDDWGILTVTGGALVGMNWDKVNVSVPTEIGETLAKGDGWELELKAGRTISKDPSSGNFKLH